MPIAKLLLLAMFQVAAPAAAQTPPLSPVAPTVSPVAPSASSAASAVERKRSDKMVCETIESTGSRLGKRKVCHSQAEWAEQRALERRDVERFQTNRGRQD